MTIDSLVAKIRVLEEELEEELDQAIDGQRERFEYEVGKKRVRFEQAVKQRHRQFKTGLFQYLFESGFTTFFFSPLVYVLIFPLVLLDLFVTIFQFICFPVYGIEKVKRSDFIVLDRQHLAYLNAIEKLNCVYCSYANGLLAYIREIAGHTEEHFCPIKHARRTKGQHPRYWSFAEYGDAQGLANKEAEITKKSLSRLKKRWNEPNGDQG